MREYFVSFFLIVGLCISGAYAVRAVDQVALARGIVGPLESMVLAGEVAAAPSALPTTPGPVQVPIFIYHSVYPDFAGETKSQKNYSVTPEQLDEQLGYLKSHGYTPVTLDDLERFIALGTTTVPKPVILTFDDGWQSEYTNAFPLLKKYGFTATFFIFTNPIGKDARFMTWEEVKELDAAGMTIGDHTLTHPYLTKLPIDKERIEVTQSKKVLEEKLGKAVTHFASPFGQTNDQLVELLKEAGYTTGRTTYWGARHSKSDLMHLSGYLVERDIRKFKLILEGRE